MGVSRTTSAAATKWLNGQRPALTEPQKKRFSELIELLDAKGLTGPSIWDVARLWVITLPNTDVLGEIGERLRAARQAQKDATAVAKAVAIIGDAEQIGETRLASGLQVTRATIYSWTGGTSPQA